MKSRQKLIACLAVIAAWLFALVMSGPPAYQPKVGLQRDDAAARLKILIEGREALVYQYASSLDLPHFWPMNSPDGKSMLVQQTEPNPHHRSFWFADTVRLNGGREVSLYTVGYFKVKWKSMRRSQHFLEDENETPEYSHSDVWHPFLG